jgi:type IV pilus assembly protein PilW
MSKLLSITRQCSAKQAGFSLIEVLIAMGLGMLGILAIMQAFAVTEKYKESTTGTNSAQTNGSIALFSIERDVRMAGYGIASTTALGCGPVQYYYNSNYTSPPGGTLAALRVAPVMITQGSGSTPQDIITTFASTASYRFAPAILTATMASASAAITPDTTTAFAIGDLVMAVNSGTCAIMQVTNVLTSTLEHTNMSGAAPFNPPSGSTLPAFAANSQLFNLGRPQIRTYAVTSSDLTVADWLLTLAGTPSTVIVDEIVDLQAEYGLDDGGGGGTPDDGKVDTYTTVTPTSAAGWQQLLAIRFAVMSRGPFEQPNASGTCTATTAAPTWAGGTLNLPTTAQSGCYRYRVFETTVPIRNMIWRDA